MRHAIRSIIEMFDPSIKEILSPTSLRSPANMLTLDRAQHELFASLMIYFERTSSPFEYRLWSPLEDHVGRRGQNYTTVKLTSNEGIEPPSERLLDIHRIMARILAASGAREYVNLMVERWEESTGGSG